MPGTQTLEAWNRIDAWLTRHAPSYRAGLNGPADAQELRNAEQQLGLPLSSDLTAWWSQMNGLSAHPPSSTPHQGHLLPERNDPHGLSEALRDRAMHIRVIGETVPPPLADEMSAWLTRCGQDPAGTLYPDEAAPMWLPHWLPIAGDGGGGGLFTDLRPGPLHGCVVAFDRNGHGAEPKWPSVASMLTFVADAFEDLSLDAEDFGDGVRIGRWAIPWT
ncbi:SMI1/KNR4 family protein [Streptomyces decoyicus]|uniref:SMI1/KNR4 family protein n=1 Tax=Streptomyces decoyicus TaxID=249567 RepID=A0ABZ1F923_9ACTN|nr:SMI1/KNR4 family protein [Streptomyces decoyicus]WSB66535.1 SMI1/KNR4 family protein [Streptomyces decoyicus]